MVHSLTQLLDAARERVVVHGDPGIEITGIELDSRAVIAGSLFCCLRGELADGHEFAAAAVAAGAVALLVDHRLDLGPDEGSDGAPVQLVVADTRVAMGVLAAAFWGYPAAALTMVGVTGTNGKTTTTNLIGAVLEHAGRRTGTIGTLTGAHTTPESPELQRRLAEFVADGVEAVVMEVSSHALQLARVAGTRFDLAVFTNLGRDHLDLHGTVERYFAAKASLFTRGYSDEAVINGDDEFGRRLLGSVTIPSTPFSLDEVDDLQVEVTRHRYRWRGEVIDVAIGGRFNAMNSLAAATACAALGISVGDIAAGLRAAPPVPGRFEPVRAGQPFDVIVDFAHTPEGLRQALVAARPERPGARLIAVFGCGGDRDRDKRPEMGAVAAEIADDVVVTSDNPRSEPPLAIVHAIIEGVPANYRDRVVIEPDRRLAIAAALGMAREGDVVLIAGKGHEATQTIGPAVLAFDDRVVVRELLEARS